MTKREKLIIAIKRAKEQSEEYGLDHILVDFKAADMILELLKEQKLKLVCPKCNGQPKGVVCGICGQAVKLDDT